MENIKELIKKWDIVFDGIYDDEFNLEHFQEADFTSLK